MTFWIDAHLDPELPAWLGANFKVIAKTVMECGLRDADDDVIFFAARRLGPVVLVTKDSDFVELVHRHGSPPQVLLLTFGNMRTIRMQIRLRATFPDALLALQAGEPVVEID